MCNIFIAGIYFYITAFYNYLFIIILFVYYYELDHNNLCIVNKQVNIMKKTVINYNII
jgi:hypothetical protein